MNTFIDSIYHYCSTLDIEFDKISEERQQLLLRLSDYFFKKYQTHQTPKTIVICTHNSRRSHLGQIWLAVGADYFGLPSMESYSGGTEATAFNPRAIAALRRVGFHIQPNDAIHENPHYYIQWKQEMTPYEAFSKIYEANPNPTKDFAAVMVCSEADEACPMVFGTDFRLALPFEDPKKFDGTTLESAKYDERCRQIAREIFFVLKNTAIRMAVR